MKTVQVAARQPVIPVESKFSARKPVIPVKNKSQSHHLTSLPCISSMNAFPLSRTSLRPGARPAFGLPYLPVLKSQQPFHVCLAGGKGMMGSNEDSRWKSPEAEIEKLKGDFAGLSDEIQQIILATIGFILVYICVIDGVELAKLSKDILKYLFGGTQSLRLKKAIYKWTRFFKLLTGNRKVLKNELEEAPTQRNNLDYYHDDVLRNYMKPNSDA
uniref:Uncharacterized protein n=1 Tax=Lotus japonicus TaxID=34305 RepID=I3T6J6_LOTJA|nr:unknown [Lotus japonicus]